MEPSTTDWIQAGCAVASLIVGVIGVVLVLRSLAKQDKVNQAQFDLLKIESNRAAREVRPELFGTIFSKQIPYNLKGKGMCRYYSVQCTANPAYGVCLEYLSVKRMWCSPNMLPGEVIGTLLPEQEVLLIAMFVVMMGEEITIRIHHKDVDNRHLFVDYTFGEHAVNKNFDYPATPYPGSNKISKLNKIEFQGQHLSPMELYPSHL
jgi:hypothetical protein